jgi:hypothetical protein
MRSVWLPYLTTRKRRQQISLIAKIEKHALGKSSQRSVKLERTLSVTVSLTTASRQPM